MLDLLTTLVSRLIELFKERRESDRRLYEDFVVPAMADLEKAHENYLETFKAYRAEILSASVSLTPEHPIFERLRTDSLYSAQLRARLFSLREYAKDALFGSLMRTIVCYVMGTAVTSDVLLKGRKMLPNAPRSNAYVGLAEIAAGNDPDSRKKKLAIEALDRIIDEQQHAYGEALNASAVLRHRLLDTRIGKTRGGRGRVPNQ